MIRVVVDVRDGATRSRVVTQAESVRKAVSTAAAAYPNADVRVKFPIDAEAFFVEDPAGRADVVSFERPEEMAA